MNYAYIPEGNKTHGDLKPECHQQISIWACAWAVHLNFVTAEGLDVVLLLQRFIGWASGGFHFL